MILLCTFSLYATYGLIGYIAVKKNAECFDQSTDYFLAEGSLTWWAIGSSLIASNISAEQMVGMNSSGFTMGLAISAYEWMAAATLVIVAIFFIPVYLKNKIYTMPQFLHQRYNGTVALIMAIFWLLLYIVVNLTSILYLGAIAVHGISGINFSDVYLGSCHLCGYYYVGRHEGYWLYRCYPGILLNSWWISNYLYRCNTSCGTLWVPLVFLKGLSLMKEHAAGHFQNDI